MYEVQTQQFSGPLNKLLELIEAKKLEIIALSLAEVTEDFINYIRGLGKSVDPQVLADFIVVASRLILIKSKTLLPDLELTKEEEGEIEDLETRLKIYKEFKEASQNIKKLWDQKQIAFSRELFSALGGSARFALAPARRASGGENLLSIFYPPRNLNAEDLARSIMKLTAALKELLPEARNLKRTIVSVEEKITELLNRLTQKARHTFRDLTKEKPRQEIIAVFLAILHLFRDRFINIEQTEPFGDIILKKP